MSILLFPDENKGQEWSEDTRGPAEIMDEFRSIVGRYKPLKQYRELTEHRLYSRA